MLLHRTQVGGETATAQHLKLSLKYMIRTVNTMPLVAFEQNQLFGKFSKEIKLGESRRVLSSHVGHVRVAHFL